MSCGKLEARAAESWQLTPSCTLPAPRCSLKSLEPPSLNICAHPVAIVTAGFSSSGNRLSTVRPMRPLAQRRRNPNAVKTLRRYGRLRACRTLTRCASHAANWRQKSVVQKGLAPNSKQADIALAAGAIVLIQPWRVSDNCAGWSSFDSTRIPVDCYGILRAQFRRKRISRWRATASVRSDWR